MHQFRLIPPENELNQQTTRKWVRSLPPSKNLRFVYLTALLLAVGCGISWELLKMLLSGLVLLYPSSMMLITPKPENLVAIKLLPSVLQTQVAGWITVLLQLWSRYISKKIDRQKNITVQFVYEFKFRDNQKATTASHFRLAFCTVL